MMLPSAPVLVLIVFEKIILAPAPSFSTIISFFKGIIGASAGQSRRDWYKSPRHEHHSQTESQYHFSHYFHPFPD
jgi:hypothetical protein